MKQKSFFIAVLIIFLSITNISFPQNLLNLLIRNSSGKQMDVQLIKKSDSRVVHESSIPDSRTVKVSGLEKGAYILQYKHKGKKNWRIMNVLVIRSNKVYVLF